MNHLPLLFTRHCPARCFQAEGMKIPRQPARYGAECFISVHREASCLARRDQCTHTIKAAVFETDDHVCRNPKLANIFYRLQLIEAFKIILPNLNAYSRINTEQTPESSMMEQVLPVYHFQ